MKKQDLIYIHPPSVFDFRNRDDILFAYLSNSESVAISQIYEMYPLGIKAFQTSLLNTKKITIINLADMMLKNNNLDVESFLKTLNAKMFGIDLHWIAHTQGALSVAKMLKRLHPEVPIVFGGISSSLFYKELIEYPQVDFIIRGVETSCSLIKLLEHSGTGVCKDIPNLCWKDKTGRIFINEFQITDAYNTHVDWKYCDPAINYFITFSGAGCEYNCTFCGGSNYSMKKYLGVKNGFANKDPAIFIKELQAVKNHNAKNKRLVTLHHWFENKDILRRVMDNIKDSSIRTIHYTLFNLLPLDHVKLMSADKIRPLFEISLESHSEKIRKICGKAPYSNEELETWLDNLFKHVKKAIVEIYLMIGLPGQTPGIVMKEVSYARHLLEKYSKYNLNVFICPMSPFLDPGSVMYDNPEKFGYKIRYTKLKDYEKALLVPHWKDSLNYETQWMTRKQLVDVTYQACKKLTLIKQKTGKLPLALSKSMIEKIDSTVELLNEIEKYDRASLPQNLRAKILKYNSAILMSSASQQSPFNKSVYKNWYE